MAGRPPPTPPAPPPGAFERDGRPRRGRSRLLSARNLGVAAAVLGGAVAWGAAVRFADSLPLDLGIVATLLKVGVGIGFVVSILALLLFRGFEVGRVALVVALAVGGASLGLAVGPTVAPAVAVAGTFTLTPSLPAGLPATSGELQCTWASGRWKVGELRTTAPLDGLATPHRLTVDLLRKTIGLTNGLGSDLRAIGAAAFASPAGAPPRGDGDRSGSLDLDLLQVGRDSAPGDPNEVRARFSWDCPGPPPG